MRHEEENIAYHAMSASDVLRLLGARTDGLRVGDVTASRALHGANTLPQSPRAGALRIALRQLTGPLMVVLFAALVASMLLQDRVDAALIAVVIVLHALLGFLQEYRADRAFAALAKYLPQRARVCREGTVMNVDASDVVVGDMLLLRPGDHVVADARILRATMCEASEAALTGESQSIAKDERLLDSRTSLADRTNMLFAGTSIASGTAEAVVVAVGENTAFGKIAAMTAKAASTRTPLQEQLTRFSRRLVGVILVAVALVFAWGVGGGISLMSILPLCLALAVAAVPEGMLVALTVILARGMHRMAKRNALVRNLLAAETLGSVSVVCTDKTGTLTKGEMVVTDVQPTNDRRSLLETLALANTVSTEMQNGRAIVTGTQTELAVHNLLKQENAFRPRDIRALGNVPFDSRHKFSAYAYGAPTGRVLVAFGAPDVLLDRVDCTDMERGRFAATIEQMSRRGLRVIMAARRDDDVPDELGIEDVRDLRVVGFLGLEDPVRPRTAEMVDQCRRAGIRTIMLTGDHPGTAQAVALAVGLPSDASVVMTGVELARIDDISLRARIGEISVFARIRPEDKLRIVRALQENGATVAMTGDGVNDAPALRAADIGIAVGSGTDVAKEAADLVLLDNDFGTIVDAIREGRGLYDNIRKVIGYLVTGSFSELLLALAAIMLGMPLPLLPIHILWINLLSDGLPALALAAEHPEPDTMKSPPRPRQAPLISRDLFAMMVAAALITDGVLVVMLVMMFQHGASVMEMQSLLFLALGMTSTLFIFSFRSLRRTILLVNPLTNPALLFAVFVGIGLLVLPFLHPTLRSAFSLTETILRLLPFIVVLSVVKILVIESIKVLFSRGILEPVWTSPELKTSRTRS